jgi:hypothetical protein
MRLKVMTYFVLLLAMGALVFSVHIFSFGSLTSYLSFEYDESEDIPYFKLINERIVGMTFFVLSIFALLVVVLMKIGREHTRKQVRHSLR